uniref:hypothetical protein n=1 Tax=Bifidobacterium longum TaxID=216816 RepID=UPI00359C1B24
ERTVSELIIATGTGEDQSAQKLGHYPLSPLLKQHGAKSHLASSNDGNHQRPHSIVQNRIPYEYSIHPSECNVSSPHQLMSC